MSTGVPGCLGQRRPPRGRAQVDGRPAEAGGTVTFRSDGTDGQQLWISSSLGHLPLIGTFRWRSVPCIVRIDADGEITRWQRLEARPDLQPVRLDLDGLRVELTLRRAR